MSVILKNPTPVKLVVENPEDQASPHIITLSSTVKNTHRVPHWHGRKSLDRQPTSQPQDKYKGCKFIGELRPSQQQIVPRTINILKENRSAILSLETGGGKTITAIYIACQLKKKCVIVVHRLCLVDQWTESIKRVCDNPTIQFLKNTKNKTINPSFDFTIVTAGNIGKFTNWEFAGVVLVDECHAIMTQNYIYNLLHFTPKYLLGLSATPYRNDIYAGVQEYFYSTVVSLPKEAPFVVKKIQTNFKYKYKYIKRAQGKSTIDWNDILSQQSFSEERNKLIISLINEITSTYPNRYILAMVKRVEHAKLLQSIIPNSSTYLGNDKEYDQHVRVLIGTYSKMGIGFDHPKINTMVLCADLAESVSVEQAIGRAKRKIDLNNLPWIYDIVDNDNIMKSHYTKRAKVYKMLKGEIEGEEITNREVSVFSSEYKIIN